MAVAVGMAGCAATAAVGRWVLALVEHRHQGLDATDESFYLISAKAPDAAAARLSNFGFYLHAMLRAGGGSIAGLRLIGLSSLLAGAGSAAWAVTRWLPPTSPPFHRRAVFVGSWAAVSAVTLTYYGLWIVTPSYNSLTVALSLLIFAGLIGALPSAMHPESHPSRMDAFRRPSGGFVLVGAAGVALSDVKATAGVGIGALVLIAMVCTLGVRATRRATASIVVGLVVGAVIEAALAGSPLNTATKLVRYARLTSISGGYSSRALWETDFLAHVAVRSSVWFAFAAVAIHLVWRQVREPRLRTLIVGVAACVVAIVMWDDRTRGGSDAFASNGWWWMRMAAWSLLFVTSLSAQPTRTLVIGPIVALGALAASIGSNNGFIRQSAFAAGLFGLAVVAQTTIVVYSGRASHWRAIPALVFVLTTSLASFGAVPGATGNPYRLGAPIGANSVPVALTGFGKMLVTPGMASYLQEMHEISLQIPPDAQDCLVDLTGNSPIAALALGARSASVPWVIGGATGSAAVLAESLRFASCTSGRLVLVDAPGSAARIALPAALWGRDTRRIGSARLQGYIDEVQIVSIVEPQGQP